MIVRTRFAPSPTGKLHIGVVRTAIFNWLFAKRYQGNFYLRVEDTDKNRSKYEYIKSVQDGLKWLGIEWDGDVFFQSSSIKRHVEIARLLLDKQLAYYCYASTQGEAFRKTEFTDKHQEASQFNSDSSQSKPVIRLKTSSSGTTELNDIILGKIQVKNSEIDDMVLVRSDGTPTYLLACVVDDYDMGITHVIRGNDHLTNTFRQLQILKALGWQEPNYAHIPLIHAESGNKLSKRDGALGIEEYKDKGYLPEALFNYLLKLGWGYGNSEIIGIEEAIKIFDLKDIKKSPARFDLVKLNYINQYYIKEQQSDKLLQLVIDKIKQTTSCKDHIIEKIRKAIPFIKNRGETLNEIVEQALLFMSRANPIDAKSKEIINSEEGKKILNELHKFLQKCEEWNADSLKSQCNSFAKKIGVKPVVIMKALRAAVLGTFQSSPIYETLEILSKEEVLSRILSSVKN